MLSYRRTGEIPPALLKRPEPPAPDVEYYLEAFYLLCKFRGSNGFGINRLSYADVERHASRMGVHDTEEYMLFIEIMAELDLAYYSHFAEKRKAEAKKTQKQHGTKASGIK